MKHKIKLQNVILKYAGKPSMIFVVFFLVMMESIFLFIPAEVFMTPAIVARRNSAPAVVAAAALGSMIGGIITYLIGMFLFDSVGMWLINTFSNMEQFLVAKQMFADNGVAIIFLSALTPMPYKLLVLVAGFLGYNAFLFLGISAILRTVRFAVAGFLLWRFQETANAIVKKYFWPLTLGAIAAAGLGILLLGILG